jgi:hypothetical protein
VSRTLLLTDVTAMAADAVCIAGIDVKSGQTMRLNEPQPTRRLLELVGGLAPAEVIEVDCRPLRGVDAPHSEDCAWTPRSLKKKRVAPADEALRLLDKTSLSGVIEAFGPPSFVEPGRNRGWTPGSGIRSLASVSATGVTVALADSGRGRITFADAAGEAWANVPFQDLAVRNHARQCPACTTGYLANLQQEFETSEALIRIGLTRPYAAEDGAEPLCWLQVTNVLGKTRRHFL